MDREIVDMTLHHVVALKLKNSDKTYHGWLVRAKFHRGRYELLPVDYKQANILCFSASCVASITYDSNGVTLK